MTPKERAIRYIEMSLPFVSRQANANYVRKQLEAMDPESILADLRKPDRAAPDHLDIDRQVNALLYPQNGTVPEGTKEYFHEMNRRGKYCFDDFVFEERGRNIHNLDKGSPTFTADETRGTCACCGERIMKGDRIIIRRRKLQDQQV